MHSTHSRRDHIHGMLLGVAIGEALGYARRGLPRRTAIKLYGKKPLKYGFLPKRGIYGDITRLTFLNAQALLNSRSDLRGFRSAFNWRLSWYFLSLPYGTPSQVYLAAAKSWLRRFKVKSGVRSCNCSANGRAVFSALGMHGTGHRIPKWVEESTKLTNTHVLALECCKVLGVAGEYGAITEPGQIDVDQLFEQLLELVESTRIGDKLKQLPEFLEQGRSPRAVAREFGWKHKIPDHIIPVTIMSLYCWLRYPSDFLKSVESAIMLGGASASLGATTGALFGAHAGHNAIPEDLEDQILGTPHSADWIEDLAERFSHWPHGADDLHLAPAQISDPPVQFMRNILTYPIGLGHLVYKYTARFVK